MRCLIPSADLHLKLHETVCRYDGKPVWVTVPGNGLVRLYDLPSRRNPKDINSEDVRFDVASVPLGYVNMWSHKLVTYLSRIPIRRVKQGLCLRSLTLARIDGRKEGTFSTSSVIVSQGFVEAIEGTYPSIEKALAKLRKEMNEEEKIFPQIAISREVALTINGVGVINVFFKTEHVGWMAPKQKVVNIKEKGNAWVIAKYLSNYDWTVES